MPLTLNNRIRSFIIFAIVRNTGIAPFDEKVVDLHVSVQSNKHVRLYNYADLCMPLLIDYSKYRSMCSVNRTEGKWRRTSLIDSIT